MFIYLHCYPSHAWKLVLSMSAYCLIQWLMTDDHLDLAWVIQKEMWKHKYTNELKNKKNRYTTLCIDY